MNQLVVKKPDEKGLAFLPENSQYKNRFEIKSESSNRLYVVAQHKKTGIWSCSCPGWIIHRHCKHLRALGDTFKVIETKQTKQIK